MTLQCGIIGDPKPEGSLSKAMSYGIKNEDQLMAVISKCYLLETGVDKITDGKVGLRCSDISLLLLIINYLSFLCIQSVLLCR